MISSTFPRLGTLLYEGECTGYERSFVSIFDHWLPRSEVDKIFTKEVNEISSRQNKFKDFVDHLYATTPIYAGRFRRNRRDKLSIKKLASRTALHKKCQFHKITEDYGDVFQLIIPEYSVVYTQNYDWTHIVDYTDSSKAQEFSSIAEMFGLNWLNNNVV